MLPLTRPHRPRGLQTARQLLSERQSGVTRGQAFLSFWDNFQTLNSTAYTEKRDQSSNSRCEAQRQAPPALPRSQPRASASCPRDVARTLSAGTERAPEPMPAAPVPIPGARPGATEAALRGPTCQLPPAQPDAGRPRPDGAPSPRPFREMTFQAGVQGKVINRAPEGRAA